jgi:hypothetical protein
VLKSNAPRALARRSDLLALRGTIRKTHSIRGGQGVRQSASLLPKRENAIARRNRATLPADFASDRRRVEATTRLVNNKIVVGRQRREVEWVLDTGAERSASPEPGR